MTKGNWGTRSEQRVCSNRIRGHGGSARHGRDYLDLPEQYSEGIGGA